MALVRRKEDDRLTWVETDDLLEATHFILIVPEGEMDRREDSDTVAWNQVIRYAIRVGIRSPDPQREQVFHHPLEDRHQHHQQSFRLLRSHALKELLRHFSRRTRLSDRLSHSLRVEDESLKLVLFLWAIAGERCRNGVRHLCTTRTKVGFQGLRLLSPRGLDTARRVGAFGVHSVLPLGGPLRLICCHLPPVTPPYAAHGTLRPAAREHKNQDSFAYDSGNGGGQSGCRVIESGGSNL